jgi:DNA-binding GntR family transcriptional regulator
MVTDLGAKTSPQRPGDSVEAVYRRMRDMIVQGRFAPNERLAHGELSRLLEVGRMPIREALHRLEADGLAVSTPNRGFRVAPATVEYAEELYAARILLEPALMAGLAGVLTPAEVDRMRGQLKAMERAKERVPDFQVAHRDFHLIAAADYASPFIADLVVRVHRHLFRHQQLYMSRPRVPDDLLAFDRELLNALESGDGRRAKRVYELHLLDMAVGMVLDVEPDHEFGVLLAVARANGLGIEATKEGRLERPVRVCGMLSVDVRPVRTSNLLFEPVHRGSGSKS